MSQEYTEDKEATLKKLSSGRRILEAVLVVVAVFAIYLMAALVSFDPSDPSWSQTAWPASVHNWMGGVGAWTADTLFFVFGVLAYAIPPIMLCLCWSAFKQRDSSHYVDYFTLSLRIIGTLALILTSCGLAALNVDDIYYFASGGVVGSLLGMSMTSWLNNVGATLALLCVWAAGVTLFTGWSWLTIAEKIGSVVLGVTTFMTNRSRSSEEYKHRDEDDDIPLLEEDMDTSASTSAPLTTESLATETAASIQLAEVKIQPAEAKIEIGDDTDDVLFSAPSMRELLESQADTAANIATVDAKVNADNIVKNDINPTPVQAVPLASSLSEPAELPLSTPPPLYSFDVPSEIPPSQAFSQPEPARYDNEPQLGNWNNVVEPAQPSLEVSTPKSISIEANSLNATVALAGSLASTGQSAGSTNTLTNTFMPALDMPGEGSSQVKKGLGPELPRPNPVRLPTRRELASYGIKLPSQRAAEQQEQADASEQQFDVQQQQNAYSPQTPEEEALQQEALLRQAFQEQQNQRYGESNGVEQEGEDDQTILDEARLSQAFSEQQQTRYQQDTSEKFPSSALNISQHDVFSFSPMADLVDDTPVEPLFTLSSQQEDEPPVVQSTAPQRPAVQHPPAQGANLGQSSGGMSYSEPSKPEQPTNEPVPSGMDSLIHPFLMRSEQPLSKPTTPYPSLDLLTSPPVEKEPVDAFALEQTANLIEARLNDYRIKADVVDKLPGPVITRFELDLAPGVKAARISNLSRDLARSLSATAVRVVEVIPGKPYVGLELPNKKRQTVYLREVLDCAKFKESPSPLTIVLGKDISGEPVVADLAKMPHLLVAGTTGSGKSVGVNAMILSMLYKATPEEVRFIMIDPKMLELSVYEGIPHLLTPVVTDMKDAANALRWCVGEMERRYKLMSALGVRNLAGYNERVMQAEAMGRPIPDPFWKPGDSMNMTPPVLEKEPFIVVLVDEFADLMMTVGKKVEELIARLAQKARAAGIHLVLATQRPSVDVITGLIKANIPTRIAFTVSSKIDSRTILDQGGAESLLGMGDMLYMAPNSSIPVRVHGAFVRDQEVHAVVQDWKARGRPTYIESIVAGGADGEGNGSGLDSDEELDALFDQAVAFVIDKRRASISGVQRQFRIGYNRAARIVEQMEAQSIVSAPGHNGNREVLAPPSHE